MPGSEWMGPVKVLYADVPLGVPSATEETVYNPIPNSGISIVIPPNVWVETRRRGTLRPLSLTVFFLPDGLVTPGSTCGAALDMAPHDQKLNGSILVSLPCR